MANERTARQIRSCSQQFTTREAADDLYIEGYFAVFYPYAVVGVAATHIRHAEARAEFDALHPGNGVHY